MDDIEALHAAARRYCMERHRYWAERYAELQKGREHRMPYTYTEQDRATFPRYNILDAIRVEIERFVPDDFSSRGEALELLIAAIRSAQSLSTSTDDTIQTGAMEEERERAVAHLRGLGPDELAAIEDMPFRRTLGKREAEELQRHVSDVWGDPWSWIPLSKIRRADVEAFQERRFLEEGADRLILRSLEPRGVERVFALREWEPHWETDLGTVDFRYDGAETLWFDRHLDWIVFASHERSVTVGGWLLAELRAAWPDWQDRVWTSSFD